MELTWLSPFAEQWQARASQNRQPHAVLLAGPPGTGKRAAAAWMVAHKLGLSHATGLPEFPFEQPAHADLHWLSKAEDRHAILIDQVRGVVADLLLTSYAGQGKAAVIEPANAMNVNAANSLLKTLEEPPGDALLVLIADRLGRLPATILSRCQRINLQPPAESEGLAWLDRYQPGANWAGPLRSVGNAPLAALKAAEMADSARSLARDFAAVAARQASPVEVAQAWAKEEVGFVLEWMAREVQSIARAASVGNSHSAYNTVLQRMDSRNLFCYLDDINRLRGQQSGSFNVQLALEGLLIDWATGLTQIRTQQAAGSLT